MSLVIVLSRGGGGGQKFFDHIVNNNMAEMTRIFLQELLYRYLTVFEAI